MFSNTIHHRLISASLIMLSACHAAACQSAAKQGAPPPSKLSEAETVASSLWRTISTTCPVAGGTSTSTFLRHDDSLVEFRDVRTSLFQWHVTKADELNGTQFKGLAVLRGSVYRYAGSLIGKWSSWEPPRETRNNIFDSEELYREHGGYRFKWPEMWVVVVEKRNDRWLFKFSQFETPETLDQTSLAAAATKKSCAELTSGRVDAR